MLPWVCSVIDHRGRQNVVKTSMTQSPAARVPRLCFYHILTSSVICYWKLVVRVMDKIITKSRSKFTFLADEPSVTIQQCPALVTEGYWGSGVPSPRTAWIREKTGEVISSNKIHQITAIKSNESSNYLCLASNGIGRNSTKSCSVDVRCKYAILFFLYYLEEQAVPSSSFF